MNAGRRVAFLCFFRIPRSAWTKDFGILLDAVQVMQDGCEHHLFTFMMFLSPFEVAQERIQIVHAAEDEQNILDMGAGKFRLAFELDKIDQAIDPDGLFLSISLDDVPPYKLKWLFRDFLCGFAN